jgi:pilus assembly protein Flp/PilA
MLKRFWTDDRGTETVEWGILAGLIVAGLVASFAAIGTWVHGKITTLETELGA